MCAKIFHRKRHEKKEKTPRTDVTLVRVSAILITLLDSYFLAKEVARLQQHDEGYCIQEKNLIIAMWQILQRALIIQICNIVYILISFIYYFLLFYQIFMSIYYLYLIYAILKYRFLIDIADIYIFSVQRILKILRILKLIFN